MKGSEVLRVLNVRRDKILVLIIWCLGHLVKFIQELFSEVSPVFERPSVTLVHGWGNLDAYGHLVNGLPCELLPEAVHVEHHLVPHANRGQILCQEVHFHDVGTEVFRGIVGHGLTMRYGSCCCYHSPILQSFP